MWLRVICVLGCIPAVLSARFAIITYVDSTATAQQLSATARSLREQQYRQWHWYVLDEGAHVSFMDEHCTVLKNAKPLGEAQSVYSVVRTLDPADWILFLTVGDTLVNPQALGVIEAHAQRPMLCMTGALKNLRTLRLRVSHHHHRKEWPIGYPLVVKAQVLQECAIGEFFDETGTFAKDSFEARCCVAALSRCGKRQYVCAEKPWCIRANSARTRARDRAYLESYERSIKTHVPTQHQVSLIVFSKDRPLQLYAFLESAQHLIVGDYSLHVLYLASDESFEAGYAQVRAAFPQVQYLRQKGQEDFRPLTMELLVAAADGYVMFAVDDIVVKDAIDLPRCIALMEWTKARGVYTRLGTHLTTCYTQKKPMRLPQLKELIPGEVYAWSFITGTYDWACTHTLDMTLYTAHYVRHALREVRFKTPNQLEGSWGQCASYQDVGICFANSAVVNIPMNVVQRDWAASSRTMNYATPQELLDLFMSGKKLSIGIYYQVLNSSPHSETPEPVFIDR